MSTVSRFLRSVPYTSILKPRYNHGHFSTKPSHLSNLKVIDIPKYSLMGWSYGSTVSLIHAAKYPDAVEKLVIWGAQSHLLPRECINYERLKEQSFKQPLAVLNTRIAYYGREITKKQMAAVFDAMVAKYKPLGGDICSAMLPNIRCPTFILYGAKDGITDSSHVTYLNHHIKNSRVFVYPEGKHAIHMRFADDFNRRVQEFLLEPTCNLGSTELYL